MNRPALLLAAMLTLGSATAPTATAESSFTVVDDVVKIALDTGEELPQLPPQLPTLFDAPFLENLLGDPRPIRCIWNATLDYRNGLPYDRDPSKIMNASLDYIATVTECVDKPGLVVPCFDDEPNIADWLLGIDWDLTKILDKQLMVKVPAAYPKGGGHPVTQHLRLLVNGYNGGQC